MNISLSFLSISSYYFKSPLINQNYLSDLKFKNCIISNYFSTFLKFSNFNNLKIHSTTFKNGLSRSIQLENSLYNNKKYDSRLEINYEKCLITNSIFSSIRNGYDGGAIISTVSLRVVNSLFSHINCHEASILSYGYLSIEKCSFIDLSAEQAPAVSSKSLMNPNITINQTNINNVNSIYLFGALYLKTNGFCLIKFLNSTKTSSVSWVGFCQIVNPLLDLSFVSIANSESQNNGALALNNCYKIYEFSKCNFIQCKQTTGNAVSAAALFFGALHYQYNIKSCIFHECLPGNGFVVSCENEPFQYLYDCYFDNSTFNQKQCKNSNIKLVNEQINDELLHTFDEIPIGYDEQNYVFINETENNQELKSNNLLQSPVVVASFASLFACIVKFIIDLLIQRMNLNQKARV